MPNRPDGLDVTLFVGAGAVLERLGFFDHMGAMTRTIIRKSIRDLAPVAAEAAMQNLDEEDLARIVQAATGDETEVEHP